MRLALVLVIGLGWMGCGGGSTANTGPVVSGCMDKDYADETGKPMVELGIVESSNAPPVYSPRCITVSVGTQVVLPAGSGDPLQAEADVGGVANPFRASSPHMAVTAETMSTPGYYGFYSTTHGTPDGTGMAGAIHVVP